MKKNIAIIDYGVGNVHSVRQAIEALGYSVEISNDPYILSRSIGLVLPGVGAFEVAMNRLHEENLIDPLNELVLGDRKPLLGICLGMQLLANSSVENGVHQGLGWISGNVIRIKGDDTTRVPHVGWNDVEVMNKRPLFDRLTGQPNFYFDHSYHFACDNREDVAATVSYGGEIVAAVKKDNIHGVQFHPEKSQINGLRLLKGFINSI